MVLMDDNQNSANVASSPKKRLLISAPPFVNMKNEFYSHPVINAFEVTWMKSAQQMSEEELLEMLPSYDGWILGDDPCSRKVLQAGKSGALKAVVKWGVGTDNIDFAALTDLDIDFNNTPGVFGKEVADLAFAYLVMLSRHVIKIHNHVLLGEWIKPPGISLSGKNVALIGYGDIGKNISKHLHSAEMNVHVYEVDATRTTGLSEASLRVWPESISEMDAIVLACALTPENSEMIDKKILSNLKEGALIVNVSRGGLINEVDLVEALNSGRLGGVALDVFQVEPLPSSSRLRKSENVIFGTHNASNTSEAVIRTSLLSIEIMNKFLRKSN
jgi:D-3-phosphoglycerate dehydrogenase